MLWHIFMGYALHVAFWQIVQEGRKQQNEIKHNAVCELSTFKLFGYACREPRRAKY